MEQSRENIASHEYLEFKHIPFTFEFITIAPHSWENKAVRENYYSTCPCEIKYKNLQYTETGKVIDQFYCLTPSVVNYKTHY